LSLDVDGVLTDGGLYYADDGSQLRKFNVKDGMGMKLARKAGVEVCIVTASQTAAIHHRGEVLGIPHVFVGVDDKLATLKGLCETLGIAPAQVAHMGDDLNDLPLMEMVGLTITVADAVDAVLENVDYVTRRKGGDGAVREICDLVLKARDYWPSNASIPPAR
jgi:3-deoxy-D-manno-octulosonate 8-phosphate phosphatase (KDO 8-P phosphatase)